MRRQREQGTNGPRRGMLSPYLLVTLASCLLAFVLLGLKLPEPPNPERLLEEGHAAFARGDYTAAAALYEQAETYSTEPARVAFYLAGAKYHLAVTTEGPSPELVEAERLYRCCLDKADARRSRALYGLGNCLLHRAAARDAAGLRTAIACYDQCLSGAADDEELSSDARYNREKARLLLLQFQQPANGRPNDHSHEDEDMYPPRPEQFPSPQAAFDDTGSDAGAEGKAVEGAVKPDDGKAASKSNDPPSPGRGNLDPIPDEVDVPPLSSYDAAEHLELATKKVLLERQTFHRRSERASSTGVKDW